MHRTRNAIVGGIALLAGVGMLVQGQTYASGLSARAHTTKTIKAKEVNSKYIFAPKKTTVHVGTKVTWTNTTDAAHTVTFTSGVTFNKVFKPGKAVSFTLTKAGMYHYLCRFHAGMVGTITVTQ